MVICKGDNNQTISPRFKKTLLALSITACAQGNVFAQDSAIEQRTSDALVEEEIIVTGIRGNLKNAQDIKRNSDTFVDAISAKDIGSLPDVSVLETLQRLPGISIERFASPRDSDHFSSEGSGATLRGLPQTRTSFNGRDSFSATSNRGLSFEDVSPELLGSVGVFKNQTADMVEGGISGTINLNTRKPFDSDDRVLDFSAQANYNDLIEETTPSYSGLYSDRFELSGGGEIGWLFSYANSELEFRADGAELGMHVIPDGSTFYAPINAGIRSTDTERNREGLTAALQFRNADDSFEGTLEYIRSDSDITWVEHAFFSDDAAGTLAAGAEVSGNTVQSGRLLNVQDGLGPQTRRNNSDELVQDLSLNLKFQATDRLSLEADFQYVDAESENLDLTVFGGLVTGVDIGFNAGGGSPQVEFHAPTGSSQSDEEYFADPSNYFWRAGLDHIDENEGDEFAVRFDVDYEINSGIFESVETGVRFAEREQTTRYSTFNWQNLSEAWNEGFRTFDGRQFANGDGDATGPSTAAFSPDSETFGYSNFFRGDAGSGVNALFPSTNLVQNYQGFIDGLNSFPFNQGPLDLFQRNGVIAGTPYLPAEINEVTEENTALYVRLNFGGGDLNRFSGNVGLRYVQVDTTVAGGLVFPTPFGDRVVATAEQRAFANGGNNTQDAENDFSTVLPSFNVKYEITDDLITRFGYSAAISFPDLGDLRYNFNITGDTMNVPSTVPGDPDIPVFERFQQTSGNPFLEPTEADNLDLSLEWYFSDTGSLTTSIFYKDIKNFFSIDTVNQDVTNNGVTQTVEVTQPINIGKAKLRGFEFAYQQFFDGLPAALEGLGVQFNYTYLNESGVPNQNTSATEIGPGESVNDVMIRFEGLPLQGLSEHSYNLVGMYENHGISARLAYNWRDDYLLSINHVNLNVPVFAEDRGQLDGSIFYSINETIKIGLQGSNLTNEETNTLLQVDQEGTMVTRSSFVNDRRFSFIVRASL